MTQTEKRRPFSVRRFLLISLTGIIATLWMISAFRSYQDARSEVNALFDAQLAESAKVLLAQAGHEIHERESDEDYREEHDHNHNHDEDDDEDEREGHFVHRYGQKLYFQIWNNRNQLLLRSGSEVPVQPLSPSKAPDGQDSAYDTREILGERYRVFSLWNRRHRLQIQIAQRMKLRERLSNEVAFHITAPMLLALPVLAMLILWSVNRAFRSLSLAAAQVASRDPDHLQELSVPDCPSEALPLVHAINSLLSRLKNALQNERRFTSDAAHELRTPLAGLKTQAEVAMSAASEKERAHALSQIAQAVDRTSHLISQLLSLARLDPDATLERKENVDLEAITGEVLRELAPQALAKRQELSLSGTGRTPHGNPVLGNSMMLSVLVRNLVDNAIRYTPEGGEVRVTLGEEKDAITFEVRDTGPGIPRELQTRVFDRFFRISSRAAATSSEGSGLGLSIVKRIVEIHSGRIELSDPPGLKVRVIFPKAS